MVDLTRRVIFTLISSGKKHLSSFTLTKKSY